MNKKIFLYVVIFILASLTVYGSWLLITGSDDFFDGDDDFDYSSYYAHLKEEKENEEDEDLGGSWWDDFEKEEDREDEEKEEDQEENKPKEDNEELSFKEESGANDFSLMECLKEEGVVIYGSKYCGICTYLVEEFGGSEKVSPIYVDCEYEEERCREEKITYYYPEIQIKGELYEGERSLDKIARETNCEI